MTQTTKDIINRAKRIADLENSDFITYNEQIQMLNDCYNEVYKKTISVDKELQTFCYELVTSYPEEYLTKIYACDNITVVNEDSERLFSIINSKEVQ